MSVVTLLTVQNTCGVTRVETMAPELVTQQLASVLSDIAPGAAKSGALGHASVVEAVASAAKSFTFPLVVDPVMMSKHGHALLDPSAQHALIHQLLPLATLLTPNTHEAAALTGRTITTLSDARDAAKALLQLGPKNVLVKGGHLDGNPIDVLISTDGTLTEFHGERIDSQHTHGTGCTLSAAITAHLAHGRPLIAAVDFAKRWLTEALRTAPGLGHGTGPLNHFAALIL